MRNLTAIAITILLLWLSPLAAQQDADLAKKLANPIAALISFPIQANYSANIGPTEDGSLWRINIQPVIPFGLSENVNVISRTIIPIVSQNDIPVNGAGESGIGDVVQSLFFSPANVPAGGIIWGIGPVLLLPTATNNALGGEKFGIGPTALALKQSGKWTFGGLVNHIVSVAGEDTRADVNATFIQPFMSYITKTRTTFGLAAEMTYDWENEAWSVPIILTVSQMLKTGSQIFQIGVGAYYWADSPDGGPEDLGARVQLVFLFPK